MMVAPPEDIHPASMHPQAEYSADDAGVTETANGFLQPANDEVDNLPTVVDAATEQAVVQQDPVVISGPSSDTRGAIIDIRGASTDTGGENTDTRGASTDTSGASTDIRGASSHRYPTRLSSGSIPPRGAPPNKLDLVVHEQNEDARREIRKQLILRSSWRDTEFAFKISVRMAMRDRPEEARPVIMAELQQMVDKRVWHAVHLRNLSEDQRKRVIRSSMFLKDKYLASGAFERFKARLVAGGDMQDKSLYENLSSPTASTTSVLTIAAIAAAEERHVITIDIGGAFLNADMAPTGIKVHMRLDKVMTTLLQRIDPTYTDYVEVGGTVIVELDKALYGCVEAAGLWYEDLRKTIERDGSVENPYDVCIFNKICSDGIQ
jgi:hypothetical protein